MSEVTRNPDFDLFARIKDGQIVEFPVYRLHIKNRAHPLSWYTPVTEEAKPELPPFHYHKRTVSLNNGAVTCTYTAIAFTLAELLAQLKPASSGLVGEEAPVPLVSELDPALVAHVYELASEYLTDKLVAFAKTRGYGTSKVDAFTSLLSYLTSGVAKFKAEAERGQMLRDTAWANLLGYFQQVTTGEVPVPTSIDSIEALIPAMRWPDEDPVEE